MVARFLPRRLKPRVWLISTPLSVLSLERRAGIPRLPLGRRRFLGLPLLAAGLALWAWSARTLITRGEGTPDPDNPPRLLVKDGPYRYSRNPMMVAALLSLSGVALLLRSLLLLLYVLGLALALHQYLVRIEEPELSDRFGHDYREYAHRVPRWLPPLDRHRRQAPESAAREV